MARSSSRSYYVHIATAHVDKGLTGAVVVSGARSIGHRQGHGLHHDHCRSRMCVPTCVTVRRERDLLGYDLGGVLHRDLDGLGVLALDLERHPDVVGEVTAAPGDSRHVRLELIDSVFVTEAKCDVRVTEV